MMRTKIVYSVVSSVSDFYLEQTLMSAYTLRLYNKDAHVVLVVDNATKETITGKRAEVLNYINEVISVPISTNYSKVQRSRFLKTSLRRYIEGDYLFIDSDTLITKSLEDVDKLTCEIGATADKHVEIGIHPMKAFIKNCSDVVGFHIDENSYYYNSGVMFVKDNQLTRDFYEEWHNNWKQFIKKNINSDQASLAKTNESFGYMISDIGGEWNCQLTDNGLKYFEDAKIIHYFASTAKRSIVSPYSFYQADIYNKIKEDGSIPLDVIHIIEQPKKGFVKLCRIVTEEDMNFLDSHLHSLYIEHPRVYIAFLYFAKLFNHIFG